MQNKYAEVTPRNFNPMWAPALSDEARKAVNAAFDAMSTWRRGRHVFRRARARGSVPRAPSS